MSMEDDYADLRMALDDCSLKSLDFKPDKKQQQQQQQEAQKEGIETTGRTVTVAKDEESTPIINAEAAVPEKSMNDFDSSSALKKKMSGAEDPTGEEEFSKLTEDIYSLMFTAKVKSQAFLFAIFVFCFQIFLVLLISLDLIEDGSANPLKVPPGVNLEVTIAQAFALVLAVATQDDLLTAVIQIHDGYDKRVKEVDAAFTFTKWLLACICQFVIGASMLVVIFILIVQSKDVIGMMLNFAALSFVSEIDNVAFKLATYGFVSDSVERECKQVDEYQFPTRKNKSKWFRRVAFVLITAGLMGGWGYIVDQQRAGTYLSTSIFVQFGDAYDPYLSTFSGHYDFNGEYFDRRLVYVERRSGEAYFAYCDDEKAWTFNTFGNAGPCGVWNASSPETKEYDITKAGSPWTVAHADFEEHIYKDPIDMFTVDGNDCQSQSDCSDFGRCVNSRCECDGNRYGRHCEFRDPCPLLSVDRRTLPFPTDEAFPSVDSASFSVLKNETDQLVLVYDRPVYAFDYGNGFVEMIAFIGRRWIVFDSFFLFDVFDETEIYLSNMTEVIDYLSDNFHGYFNGYKSYFVSAAQDVGTPSDTGTPTDLQWFRVKQTTFEESFANVVDERKPILTNLICAFCVNGINECANFGECIEETGNCTCLDGFFGDLCEAAGDCNDVGCRVGGTCDENSGVCTCPDGFGGDLCELNSTLLSDGS